MTKRTDEDLATLLRVRCTSGGSDEREIICKAADKIDELEKDLKDALGILGRNLISAPAENIERIHTENRIMSDMIESIRSIVRRGRNPT